MGNERHLPQETIQFALASCTLGTVLVACSDKGVCAITLHDDANVLTTDLQKRFPLARLTRNDMGLQQTVIQVINAIESPHKPLDIALDMRGTAFQQRVWQHLRTIRTGTTTCYRDIAQHIGQPGAARAVAGACASNPLAVVVPCHRVLRSDGQLSGYRWGLERKRALLEKESKATAATT